MAITSRLRIVHRGFLTALALLLSASILHAQEKPETLAQQSAEAWVQLVDSGKYSESWDDAASLFKAAVGKPQWVQKLHASRDPFGKLLSRKLQSATYTQTLPGVPDGEYVVIRYDSSFEHKQSALEMITPMLDKDGVWRVSGYFIK